MPFLVLIVITVKFYSALLLFIFFFLTSRLRNPVTMYRVKSELP